MFEQDSIKKNIPEQSARRYRRAGWRIMARLGLVGAVAAGSFSQQLTSAETPAQLASIDAPTDGHNLQQAVRLNPPKQTGPANNRAYIIGDSLTVGLGSKLPEINFVDYAASKGLQVVLNGKESRSLYLGCDLPNRHSACTSLSDGITQITANADKIKDSCTFGMWLGTNQAENNAVYKQKYAQAYDMVNRIWDENPAQTCPDGQRLFMAVNLPTGGPRAGLKFGQQMAARNQIIAEVFSNLDDSFVLDMNGFVTVNGLLNNSSDGVHASFSSIQQEAYFMVDALQVAIFK